MSDAPPRRSSARTILRANKRKGLARKRELAEIEGTEEITETRPGTTQVVRSSRDVLKILQRSLTNDKLLILFERVIENAGRGDSASLNFFSKHILCGGKISIDELRNPSVIEKS